MRPYKGPHCAILPFILLSGHVLGSNVVSSSSLAEPYGPGEWPQVRYQSTAITHPLIHVAQWNESCDNDSYVLLVPHPLSEGAGNKIMMFDYRGNLVWYLQEKGAVHNAQVQSYNGADYITYWTGNDEFPGHGAGYYKMLDETYKTSYVLSAAGERDGDYHEFTITRDDTALITAWVKTPANLTSRGRQDGFIWDCVFQEVDIATNDLLFEWKASDHFTFDDMAVDSWATWTGTSEDPWDWFHLNSVEKDVYGNYLLAARYTNAIMYVDGNTGDIRWQIGGDASNDFIDISEGNATRFIDPHMARWDDHHRCITLFDNVDFWTGDKPTKRSKALKIAVDVDRKIVEVVQDFRHPDGTFALSEGSIQHLSTGNYLVGYGSIPTYSEFSSTGDHLCEAHYASLQLAGDADKLGVGSTQTYRIYKHTWTGLPHLAPVVKHTTEGTYIHWNGATQLCSWQIEERITHRKSDKTAYKLLGRFLHDQFETKVRTGLMNPYATHRLTAYNTAGHALGMWIVDGEGQLTEMFHDTSASRTSSLLLVLGFVIAASIGFALFRKRKALWTRSKKTAKGV